jgi:hypothetical protein
MYRNAIIPFVWYECETRSLTVHSLKVIENRVVWRIYGLQRERERERERGSDRRVEKTVQWGAS